MKYSVRFTRAEGGYVDKIRWMDRVCFPIGPSITFDGAFWFLAYDEDNVPVGYSSVSYFNTGNAFLSRVGVLPGARGNGLQRRFVRARERHARVQGYKRMVTYTSAYNVRSSNNLIRCGYSLYTPPHEWGLRGANYWERKL